ncbi:MAG: class I SAM-dependent methyltransferase [Betaproteobacteria bacterium]
MDPREIARSYDQLADRWNSDAFLQDYGIRQHERAIAFVKEKRTALDVGCGSNGRIIDLLTKCGFSVEGLDLSTQMIELAKQRHPNVIFHHADICEWDFSRAYDLITAWDSIWHVPLAHQEPVLKKIMQGLSPGGVCIFTTGGLNAPSEKVDSAMGPQMYYSTLGIPKMLQLISSTGCVCRHLEYDQYPELHLCVIAQRA